MAIPTPQITGLGLDGYVRIQKEVAYGTDIVTAMTDLKILPESLMMVTNQIIEVNNQVASRVKQDPDTAGRIAVTGTIEMEQDPATIGAIYDIFLDQVAVTGDATDGYLHAYTPKMTGDGTDNSATIQQAIGSNLADQYAGCVITGMTLASDNEGNQKASLRIAGQGHTGDVARQSSWSFGAVPSFNFGMTTVSITFDGFDAYTQCVKSYEFVSDLGYNVEDWCLGSREIVQPTYSAISENTLTMTIDADATLLEMARNQTKCSILLTTTHTSKAGSSGVYANYIEIPEARLNVDVSIPNTNEKATMDLAFTVYGGTTTNSGAVVVPYELRANDATATYA